MAQTRFHNYRRPIVSLDENARISSLLPAGVYGGFDTLTPTSGNQVVISHDVSGIARTALNGTQTPKLGCVVSKQGVVIYEDTAISINVDFNPDPTWRIDLLVCNHAFLDSEGGAPATYNLIKNFNNQALTPFMVGIGYIFIPPAANNHASTRYLRLDTPATGGGASLRLPNPLTVAQIPSNNPLLNDFNKVDKPGLHYISTTTNRPTTSTPDWFLLVMRNGNKIVQLAQAQGTGKIYARSTTGAAPTGTSINPVWAWQPWQNLNNVDIPTTDLSDIWAAIGDRVYTDQNFITDGQSLTASLDIVDQVLGTHDLSIQGLLTDVSNLLAMVGDLNYPSNNYLTDGASLTNAAGTLDAQLKIVADDLFNSHIDNINWRTDLAYAPNWSGNIGNIAKFKIVKGLVYMAGYVSKSSDVNQGEVAFTLPVGYRPNVVFPLRMPVGPAGSSGLSMFIDIYSTGEVRILEMQKSAQVLSNRSFYLDGIQFPINY